MRDTQSGVSLMGLITSLILLVIVALFGMKVVPSYMEFATAKSTIEAISRDPGANTPQLVRNAFEARSAVDNISSIKAADLDVAKQGNQMVIEFAYRKEVPLFRNVGLYIDFAATTREQ